MKKISYWAKNHTWPVRIMIVTGFILLSLLGLFTGQWLRDLLILLPRVSLFLFISIYLAGAFFYPVKK